MCCCCLYLLDSCLLCDVFVCVLFGDRCCWCVVCSLLCVRCLFVFVVRRCLLFVVVGCLVLFVC